jgi:citrate lyase subunit beta/citryl-CoA lyase
MTQSTHSYDPSTARSFLYVPGDSPGMLSKALTRGADAVIVDLEDGVSPSAKVSARSTASEWISNNAETSIELWVRVNPSSDLLDDDLGATVQRGLFGVYLPKASSAENVRSVAQILDRLEYAHDLPSGSIQIAPLLETASAILEMSEIAASPRVSHIAIGEADLAADLGMNPSPDGRELNPVRLSLVVASAAVGLARPIGPVQTAFEDLDSLRSTSMHLRRMGYRGRAAVHPMQIPVINETFLATRAEIDFARDVVDRFESAQADGAAVTVAQDGSLIDEAVARRARVILDELPPIQGR